MELHLSGRNEKGRQQNNESKKAFVKAKEYVWHQNKDYVGGEWQRCAELLTA